MENKSERPSIPIGACLLYVKRYDILIIENKTNSNERELVLKMSKEIRKSPSAQN